MKRGTPDHPKTRQLSLLLRLKRYEVVGVLESLWHFTAAYAKRGDIGRWPNATIAAAIEWTADADELIKALTDAGFLDNDPRHRLLVHDWADHADQTVFRSEEVKKLGFASPTLEDSSSPPANASSLPANASRILANASSLRASCEGAEITPANASQPKPEPLPKPRPCQSQSRAVADAVSSGPPAPDGNADANGSEMLRPEGSGSDRSDNSDSTGSAAALEQPASATAGHAPAMPGAENFAVAIAVKLKLPDIGRTKQGKWDEADLKSLYRRHILPGHLGPPEKAVRTLYNEAQRIGGDSSRTNKAGTFIGCVKKRLAEAGHEWD